MIYWQQRLINTRIVVVVMEAKTAVPLGHIELADGILEIFPMNDVFAMYMFSDPIHWETSSKHQHENNTRPRYKNNGEEKRDFFRTPKPR